MYIESGLYGYIRVQQRNQYCFDHLLVGSETHVEGGELHPVVF